MSPNDQRKCPICGHLVTEQAEPRFKPFCSKRCANVDLGRWLGDTYAIPATEQEDEDGESSDMSGNA